MKLSEVARYWAAKELTRFTRDARGLTFSAPFACPAFTLSLSTIPGAAPRLVTAGASLPLRQVSRPLELTAGRWVRAGREDILCVDLPKGMSRVAF